MENLIVVVQDASNARIPLCGIKHKAKVASIHGIFQNCGTHAYTQIFYIIHFTHTHVLRMLPGTKRCELLHVSACVPCVIHPH